MLNDVSAMNPKGHVKLELYNDEGVFYTKEKHNLVVQSANEIVANMMADPAKVLRVEQVDKGNTALTANSAGLYPFALNVQAEEKATFESDWGLANSETEFTLPLLEDLKSLDSVKVGEQELVINQDVFLIDAAKGTVRFAVAPTTKVVFSFHKAKNKFMQMIAGTEKVTVDGTTFKRGVAANTDELTYQVDHRTGHVFFSKQAVNVVVEYSYHMNYSLGFMALGGKPNAAHQNYRPVEFGNSEKLASFMRNELPGSRMPVQYPAALTDGATEVEPSIPTQPMRTVLKSVDALTIVNETVNEVESKKLVYTLPNLHDNGAGTSGRSLYEIVSVTNQTTSANLLESTEVTKNTLSGVEITFLDADVALNDVVKVEYRLKLDNAHLTYALGQAPVMKLVAVRFTDANDSSSVKSYNIADNGLRPNEGDVWISNPSTGHITFSSNPQGGPAVHTPGHLYVEYMINAGKTVKFIADFPKGVPGPTIEDATKEVTATDGQSAIVLDSAIAKDAEGNFYPAVVTIDEEVVAKTAFSVSTDGRTITPDSLSAGQVVEVAYKYEKAIHDVYQVAMFDSSEAGKMFNISGIGPVTKDKNTGMRLSWSVTF